MKHSMTQSTLKYIYYANLEITDNKSFIIKYSTKYLIFHYLLLLILTILADQKNYSYPD